MKLFVRILLAADIILALIAGPLIVAGGGFGAGAGGSSFLQQTDLVKNPAQQTIALNLINQICDAKGGDLPKDEPAIAALASQKTPDVSFCKERADGLKISGNAQGEITSLLTNGWDARVLYAIDYLYQKRFSTPGYAITCSDGTHMAPSMTVAIHSDAGGNPYIDSTGQVIPNVTAEDDLGNTTDNSVSAHARGQAFDVMSYGCITIKDKDGKVQAIVPNSIAVGTSSGTAGDIAKAMNSLGVSADDQAAFATAMAVNSSSTMYTAPNAALASTTASITSGTQLPGTAASTVVGQMAGAQAAVLGGTADTTNGDPEMNSAMAAMSGVGAEKALGTDPGLLASGASPAKAGQTKLESLFGGIKMSAENKDKITQVITQAGASALGISPSVTTALQQDQFDQAAKLQGASELNDQLGLHMTDAQIQQSLNSKTIDPAILAQSDLLSKMPLGQAQSALALMQGGYAGVSADLAKLDQARRQEKPFQMAAALLSAAAQTKSQLTTLKDFISRDAVGKDGAVRRYQADGGDPAVLSWMQQNQNLSEADKTQALSILGQVDSGSNQKNVLQNLTASYEGSVGLGFYNGLSADQQQVINRAMGAYPPTAADFQNAIKSGKISAIMQSATLADQLQKAGLSSDDAAFAATRIFSGKSTGPQTAVDFINQKYGTSLKVTDFKLSQTPGGNQEIPAGVKSLAFQEASKLTGRPASQIASAVSSHDPAIAKTLAEKYAAKYHLPSSMIESVFKGDAKAQASEGAKLQADRIALQSDGKTDDKKQLSKDLNSQFQKTIGQVEDKAKAAAQTEASKLLVQKGISASDAAKIASGNFKGAEIDVMSAAIAKQGIINYDQAKSLISGHATFDEKYSASDAILNHELQSKGINIGSGFTKTMFDGTPQQQEQAMLNVGAGYYANDLSNLAASHGVNISPAQAQQIMANHDWSTLGTTVQTSEVNTAIGNISSSTGVPTGALQSVYSAVKVSGGAVGFDTTNAGWGVVQSYTGVSQQTVQNLTQNFGSIGQNITSNFSSADQNIASQYQNMPGQMMNMAGGMGAGIIVNTLIGGQLAKIDPTGGLLTSYAMSMATTYLMSLGIAAPYLLAAAFIINPQATMAMVQGMIDQATAVFKDPSKLISMVLSQFGLGENKPSAGVIATNGIIAQSRDTMPAAILSQVSSAAPGGGAATPASILSNVANLGSSVPDLFSGHLPAGAASFTPGMTSPFLNPTEKPTPQYIQAVSLRSADQVVEDMALLSYVTSDNGRKKMTDIEKQNHWGSFMGNIEMPAFAISAKQIVTGKVLGDGKATCVDESQIPDAEKMYNEPTAPYSTPALGASYLLPLARAIFGQDFTPVCSYGRAPGILYGKNLTAIHFGV